MAIISKDGTEIVEESKLSLGEKLMRIQTELKAPKNLINTFGNYNYRNAEGILEALKPFESKFDVYFIIRDEIIEISGRFYVKATASVFDCDSDACISTTAFAREEESKKGLDASQITGACSSYARKYALNALLLLDDSKDADSDEFQNESKARTRTTAVEKKAIKPEPPIEPAQASAPAPKQHTKDEIKQKYAELIQFCSMNGYDLKTVCAEYKLNATSTYEEFENVLRRLAYNLALNKKNEKEQADDLPVEI